MPFRLIAILAAACALQLLPSIHAQNGVKAQAPIWSKDAVALDFSCSKRSGEVPSPNGQYTVAVSCAHAAEGDPEFSLKLRRIPENREEHIALDEAAHEVLWSPNSTAFLVDGGTSAYAGFFVTVYRISPTSIKKLVVTTAAQRDMVEAFPPCLAANRDPLLCKRIAAEPEFNMSGLAWTTDSSAIEVLAEVPCSSLYGGIMCQIRGYVLRLPDGKILERLSAWQVQQRWSGNMAWKLKIPDSPLYRGAEARP